MSVSLKGNPIRENEYVSAGAIKIGDFVTLNSAGQVAVATAAQALVGVSNSQCTASGQTCNVWDHPDQMFNVTRSSLNPDALTEYNLNYDIVANTTTTAEGNHTLDSATGATTATLPLKALRPSLDAAGSSVAALTGSAVICIINNHQLKGGTGTAGT